MTVKARDHARQRKVTVRGAGWIGISARQSTKSWLPTRSIDADDIVVEVFNGEVSLNGTVPSQDQDAKAVAAAGRVAGVTVVHNLLAIALPSRDYGDDAALAQLVNAALAANRAVPDGVRATARHGDIFLTGTVTYGAQRAAAEDAVAGVAGVLSVTNQIGVLAQNDPGGADRLG